MMLTHGDDNLKNVAIIVDVYWVTEIILSKEYGHFKGFRVGTNHFAFIEIALFRSVEYWNIDHSMQRIVGIQRKKNNEILVVTSYLMVDIVMINKNKNTFHWHKMSCNFQLL